MIATFPHGNFVDCFGIVEDGRIRKSELELEFMGRAARATEAGMRAGLEAVHDGITENELAGVVHAAMFEAGGEYPAVSPYITSGPRCLIGHATWEGRPIGGDECVFLEIGGCFRRYHTAMMRTAWTGRPPKVMREAEAMSREALDSLLEFIRPGVTSAEVDHLARDILSRNDFGAVLITRAGYSIGIAFAPSWDEGYMLSLKPGDNTPLEENMTLHLIPWLYGVDGNKVMALSETVRVTANGCESFFSMPRSLYALD